MCAERNPLRLANGAIGCLIVIFSFCVCPAQQITEDEMDQYEGVGFGIEGAPGVFVVPFPSVFPQGQIGVSLSYAANFGGAGNNTNLPFSITFGMTEGIDMYAAFMAAGSENGREANRSSLGIRTNILADQRTGRMVSGELRIRRHEFSDLTGNPDLTSLMTRATIGTRIFNNLRLTANIGYEWSDNVSSAFKSRVNWGGSILVPATDDVLLGVEIARSDHPASSGGWTGAAGGRWFLLKNFQMSVGLRGTRVDGTLFGGIITGISFTTGQMYIIGGSPTMSPELLPEPPPLEDIPSVDPNPPGASLRLGRGHFQRHLIKRPVLDTVIAQNPRFVNLVGCFGC